MFKNYFKAAFRNLKSHKLYSAIHIFGLATGISSSLVIFLIVQYDFSFDKFEKGHDRIYRVVSNRSGVSEVPVPMVQIVREEVTGLDAATSLIPWDDPDLKVSTAGPQKETQRVFRNETGTLFTDGDYFKIIGYKWLAGSPLSSLSAPYQAVLTEQNAQRFFPGLSLDDVIGKEIIFNDTVRTTITGIVETLKYNTDFRFSTFVSAATGAILNPEYANSWRISTSGLLIRLSENTEPEQVKKQIDAISDLHAGPKASSKASFHLQPLSDLHFNTVYDNFGQRKAYMPVLYGLMAVAGILLLLACINFINLTTAQSSERAKEIGIRKTLGGSRKQLVFQLLSETCILTLAAAFLSVIMAPWLLKAFAEFIPEGVHFDIRQPGILLFLLITTVTVSFLSGIYPAWVLSSYQPLAVLKNQVVAASGDTRKLFIRKTLTVAQFVVAQVFIITTMVVGKQTHLELTKDMGFKKEAIIYFTADLRDTSVAKRQVLLQKFKTIPEIAGVSLAGMPPSTKGTLSINLKYQNGAENIDTMVRIKPADTNYINLYGIRLLAGANLPYSDTINSYLINEKTSQMLGFKTPQEAIGKYVESGMSRQKMPVAGVIANFIQGSLHDEIMPLIIFSDAHMQATFSIALKPQDAEGTVWKSAIAKVERSFKEIYPDSNPEIHFLDESIAKYYTAEQHTSILLKWATGLAIVISCLGLLGLVIYTTNQRTKEIGIRKVVGASVLQIITLLSKDFLRLVLLAFIIAVPIAWYAANKWLQNFAFKADLSLLLFILGGLILLLPALSILLIRTYKAAMANPVQSLKTE